MFRLEMIRKNVKIEELDKVKEILDNINIELSKEKDKLVVKRQTLDDLISREI